MAVVRVGLIALWLAVLALAVVSLGWCCGAGSPMVEGLARLTCRTLLTLLRVRVRIAGRPEQGQAARLVVANHVSWIDILVLGSIEPLCFLAKREVGLWPLIGTFARLKGTAFVDRKRRASIPTANAEMADRLRSGRSVVLFPEGTTYDGTRRGRFLTSHLACLRDRFRSESDLAACQVQAVGLVYSDPVAAWTGDASLLPHLWAVAAGPPLECRVTYGTSVTVAPGYDRKSLGRALATQVDTLVIEGVALNAVSRGRTTWFSGHTSPPPLTSALDGRRRT